MASNKGESIHALAIKWTIEAKPELSDSADRRVAIRAAIAQRAIKKELTDLILRGKLVPLHWLTGERFLPDVDCLAGDERKWCLDGASAQRAKRLLLKSGYLETRAESKEQRQARRYQLCIDSGLVMPDNDYAQLPRGIGEIAEKKEGVTRQAFAKDVRAHINRLNPRRN